MENKPLAERLRPKTLDDYIGQQAITLLRTFIKEIHAYRYVFCGDLRESVKRPWP